MDIDMNEVEKRFIKYQKKNIVLTGEQVEILEEYNIDYKSCNSINELMMIIERNKDDNNYDDLDWVEMNLAEFNYYHNTNK
jgi:hypothetical protein